MITPGNKKALIIFLKLLTLVAFIVLAFFLGQIAQESETVRNIVFNYGYAGIFLIALISGFNLVVPIPAISFLPLFIESGLNYWVTIVFITFGMAVADVVVYLLGKAGRKALTDSYGERILGWFRNIQAKYPRLPLFLLFIFASTVPLPNELLVIPLAFLNYRLLQVFPIVLAGNFVFNLLYTQGIFHIWSIF